MSTTIIAQITDCHLLQDPGAFIHGINLTESMQQVPAAGTPPKSPPLSPRCV